MDRLVESGKTVGIEKSVMKAFPNLFVGQKGNKSGMLGRWKTQADAQRWRDIPWEKLSEADRTTMKELPDWIRIPLDMPPRSLERFKEGKNVPPCIVKKIVELIERATTGGKRSQITSGFVDQKDIKKEAENLLQIYYETQKAKAKEFGLEEPKVKASLSDKWVSRLLKAYGWRAKTPNTYGAYLDYDDERMEKSRQMFRFQRLMHSVRLDMSLNFDQVWKASWTHPKKLLHRSFDVDCPSQHLRGKRDQVMNHLAKLQQSQQGQWEVKRRRITGSGAGSKTSPHAFKPIQSH